MLGTLFSKVMWLGKATIFSVGMAMMLARRGFDFRGDVVVTKVMVRDASAPQPTGVSIP